MSCRKGRIPKQAEPPIARYLVQALAVIEFAAAETPLPVACRR
jgi:hypothetical protein